MTSLPSYEKVFFILSLIAISFGYGFASHAWGWFPKTHVERAWQYAYWQIRDQGPSTFSGNQIYDRKGTRLVDPAKMNPGLTLISSSWKGQSEDGWEPELRLINREGKVLHRWRLNREEVFQEITQTRNPSKAGVHGSLLLPDGDVVMNLEYIGMARLDACGKVLWKMTERNHHAISRADDGTFWTPGVSESRQTNTPAYPEGFPGLDKSVRMDELLHISSSGDILQRINVLDVLRKNGMERYIVKGMGPRVSQIDNDPVHLNDIEPLSSSMSNEYPLFEAGDLLISLRYPDLVFVLDPETKDVKWYESRHFTRQHDPDFLGEGWIGVFDNRRDPTNRGTLLGGTRIVKIQPHTDSVTVPFPTPRSEPHYTATQGKWQQLDNGNMIVTETLGGRVVEVLPDGSTVWEWIHAPTENSKVPSVTKATRVDLTREEIASWPCSSINSVQESPETQ